MTDDLRVVYESRNRRACADRALVLAAAQIPHQIVDDLSGCALVVPAEFSPRAIEELRLYDEENPPLRPQKPVQFVYQNAVPGIIAYIIAIVLFAWLSWGSAFNQDWLAAGRIDGALVRSGEWWRSITALTMHADLRHLIGNIVFGAFFGLLAGTLNGAAFGREVVDFNADSRTSTNTGQLVAALSIEAFMEVDVFKARVDDVIRSMRASPTLPGVDAVRVPGERSQRIRLERQASGIPIHPGLADKLDALAAELGAPTLAEAG